MSPRHSRSLTVVDSLICGSNVIKMKGYRQSNPGPSSTSGRLTSTPADRGGAQVRRGDTMGGSPELRSPSSPGHDDVRFWGQNEAGIDGVLTRDETWWGTTPRWLVAVGPLLLARMMVSGGSGALLASRSSSTSSSWSLLASPGDGLARAAVG
jgi:hypothetical protein